MIQSKLTELIHKEDRKNPLPDAELAKLLNIRRERITNIRKELKIPNSRERRNIFLIQELREIIMQNATISDVDLTMKINARGYNISRFVITQLRNNLTYDTNNDNTNKSNEPKNGNSTCKNDNNTDLTMAFKSFIGSDGSLKPQIYQAKAAVLYPPHGLHTLIIGPTGIGKTSLAEAMYSFAIESKRLDPNAPFVVFNCADYSENPQLLLSQLFGHTKGAFTGASTAKEGLVNKANGGILFLDEVHRLPSEGQELLFYLLDKGKFRRLGETETDRTSNVMIIAATTEDIESTLLLTFRRRIPMIIELPPLSVRPIVERYAIIKDFFRKECERIGIKIKVTQQALRALLVYDCPGNVGQLRSDIQVACARGFLAYIGLQKQNVEITLMDLPVYIRRGSLKIITDIENFLNSDFVVAPGKIETTELYEDDLYIMPKEIYKYIERKYHELENQGLDSTVIKRIIGEKLDSRFQKFVEQYQNNQRLVSKKELESVLDSKIVDLSFQVTKIAEQHLGKIDHHLFYYLAIHLNAAIERVKQGKLIINPRLDKVKKEYTLEFKIAKEMIKVVNTSSGYNMPEDETGFIAMYLRTVTHPMDITKGHVGVIVITHGLVAQSIVDVVNRLLGINHALAINMRLDEKPESALQKTIEVVKKIDEGKGVLILVDMGSLINFGEIIMERTGVTVKVLDRVDTIMVLEAVRRAILPDANIYDIARSISKNTLAIDNVTYNPINNLKERIILTTCITGEGTALEVKKHLENKFANLINNITIQPIGGIGEENLHKKLDKIKNEKEILAIIGTLDPKENGIPFISVEKILNGSETEIFKKILARDTPNQSISNNTNNMALDILSKMIHEDTILLRPDYNYKTELLESLSNLLLQGGYVNEKFIIDVYKREACGSTLIDHNVSIPHGHPNNVIKSAVAVAILKNPIQWYGVKNVDIVFLLALKEECIKIIEGLNLFVKNDYLIKQLKNMETVAQVINVFEHCSKN